MCRQPHFDVVGRGGGKPHVAGTQSDYAVVQPQLLQYRLGMTQQLLKRSIRFVRMHHLHQLHLIELMLAYQAARIASGGACLRTEARCVRHIFERQLFHRDDFVAHHVGDRHLCGRNQIEILLANLSHLARHAKQIFLEFRQLPCAAHRIGIHKIGHIHFDITMNIGMRIEHELRERTMQARKRPLEQ